jgi:hypothetical protein
MSEQKVEYLVEISLVDYLQAAKRELNLQALRLEKVAMITPEFVIMNQRTFDNLSRALINEAPCYSDDLMLNGIFCGLKVALLEKDLTKESPYYDMLIRVC